MSERVFTQSFVAVGALIERDDRFLLVKEAGKGADEGKWNQPVGWLDLGENPQQGLCRAVELLNRVVITDPAGEAYWS